MSYQLLIFDISAAPRDRLECLAWCSWQTRRSEAGVTDDSNVLAPSLRAWYFEMFAIFPGETGASEGDEIVQARGTVYRLGRSVICAAFAWSDSDAAFMVAQDSAVRHRVGLVEASLDCVEIWRPQPKRVRARSAAK